MIEAILLSVFALGLMLCVIGNASILIALAGGYLLFFGYGLAKGHTPGEMLKFSLAGMRTVKNILLTFVLIGMITAVWRICGTIPFIVHYATRLCSPKIMLLITFLLCCFISVLTGTAFGSAATVGTICMTMACGMGISPLLTGGAILSGVFFGDRCSPMSTSALLVSELTGSGIYKNIPALVRTSLVPFVLACAFYFSAGSGTAAVATAAPEIFATHFNLNPLTALPALAIIVLSLGRLNVKITMSVSIVLGALVAIFVQKVAPLALLQTLLRGYAPADTGLNALLGGGGILSMVRVFAIVWLSSCYAGMFAGTGFLDGIRRRIQTLGKLLTPFGAMLATSTASGMVTCNQTLSIMLTHQLCGELVSDPLALAVDLENTAVVVSALIPWSIAAAVPLTTVGAPTASIAAACYLWLLPVWNLIVAILRRHRARTVNPPDTFPGKPV